MSPETSPAGPFEHDEFLTAELERLGEPRRSMVPLIAVIMRKERLPLREARYVVTDYYTRHGLPIPPGTIRIPSTAAVVVECVLNLLVLALLGYTFVQLSLDQYRESGTLWPAIGSGVVIVALAGLMSRATWLSWKKGVR